MSIVVFWEEDFPFLDTAPLTQETLRAALIKRHPDSRFVGLADLPAALEAQPALLVNPYGSAFPKAAWPAFTAYLRRGGNWVNLGGAPLTRPVRRGEAGVASGKSPVASEDTQNPALSHDSRLTTRDSTLSTHDLRLATDAWLVESPQTAYGKELRLNHAFPVELPPESTLRCPPPDIALEPHFHRFKPARAWALQVRFAERRDFPDEIGSPGGREACLRPLTLAEKDGRTLAAPIVAIDRLAGNFAGGRWVLAACEGSLPLPADLIGRLCDYAIRPRAQLDVRPSFACYYPGEMAVLTVRAQADFAGDLKINLRVFSRDTQKEVYAHIFRARCGVGPALVQTSPFPVPDPGLYIARSMVEAEGHSKPIGFAETGFWVYDRDLLAAGKPLTIESRVESRESKAEGARERGGDSELGTRNPVLPTPDSRLYTHGSASPDACFSRDGRPYPLTGTTYMAGDTHRRFLFEPNPVVWDADFAAMKAAGVNIVRTGLWSGWKRAMLEPGVVDEGVLRAFAAFLLTARRYDMPVLFTFFAFLPEAWGGENHYLDPRAVAAQTAFIAAFARRFAAVNDLLWDLINEPSFCSPARLWKCRPNYDRYERAAWAGWLRAQGVSDDEWRERWRMTPNDPLDLPPPEDFEDRHVFQGSHPLRARDYRRFAQEQFAAWAARMAAVIRENGNPHQLVTVGQDEGGTGERPGPRFHADAVDFTSNHSWWLNDALLWDSVITQTPGRLHLIEETGVMFGEAVDGGPWRTPEEARNLFERKMALAFAAGGAGFIQWQWNTNVFMNSDIEAGIGLLRADGSEKPEMEAFRGMARFFAENAHRMIGHRPEEACIVIPYSNLFGVRDTATAATQRAVRLLEYGLGLPCRAVSEYRAEEVGDARLIVLPSPRVLTEACWQALLAKVAAGATLLVTGFIEADEYGRYVPRLKPFGLETRPAPVARHERVWVLNRSWFLGSTFDGNAIDKIEAARLDDIAPDVVNAPHHGNYSMLDCYTLPYRAGRIFYCPIPLEHATYIYDALKVYELAMIEAEFVPRELFDSLPFTRVEYETHTLYLFVNETNLDWPWTEEEPLPFGLCVPAGRIALAFVDRASGKVVAKYEVTPDTR